MLNELPDERAQVARAKAAPHDFAPLYDHYAPRVYKFFRYRVDDIATAEDLTARTFERALADIGRYQPARGSFAAWLFGIASHTVKEHYRDGKRRQLTPLDEIRELPGDGPPLEQAIVDAETHAQLALAVAQLSDRERELIGLKFAGGLANTDIARITGHTESNVGVILYRSVQKLRRVIAAKEVDHDRA